jgi:hypothetical protein
MNQSQFTTPIPIVCLDPIIHTNDKPFCSSPNCPCHDDAEETAKLLARVVAGEITGGQALNIYWGQVPTLPMTARTWAEATRWLNEPEDDEEV